MLLLAIASGQAVCGAAEDTLFEKPLRHESMPCESSAADDMNRRGRRIRRLVKHQHDWQFLASGRRPRPRLRLLRSAELNAVGRGALVLLCLAGAGVGFVAARVSGAMVEVAAVGGAVLCLIALVLVDRRRWGRIETSFSWGNDSEAVVRMGVALQRQGVPVRVAIDHEGQPSLHYYIRDARKVRRALARAGIALPPS